MKTYIVGMVIGSIVLLAGFAYAIFLVIKNRSLKKLIKDVGQKAEDKINGDIKIWAKHTKNKFIPASLFSYGVNKVFEVDSILVTDKAIIVIEIKSIRGVIRGDSNDEKWTKVLGERTFPIGNPIIQNDKHIKHILKMISIKVPMVSLIVFSNRTEFIDVKDTPGHVIITREVDLFNTLDRINNSLKSRLSMEKSNKVYKMIKEYKTNARKDVKLHRDITTGKRNKK